MAYPGCTYKCCRNFDSAHKLAGHLNIGLCSDGIDHMLWPCSCHVSAVAVVVVVVESPIGMEMKQLDSLLKEVNNTSNIKQGKPKVMNIDLGTLCSHGITPMLARWHAEDVRFRENS